MKKIFLMCVLALVFVNGAADAEKSLGMKEYASVSELATAITSYFPKVQGQVTAVQGDLLTIALGTRDGLRKGVLLSVWRDGKEIHHPVTDAVIGRLEEEVGAVEVTIAGESTSIGVIKKKLLGPRQGDKARIMPKRISLALLPLRADHPEIIQGLAEQLKEGGRFDLLDSEKETAFLLTRKQRDTSLISEMGRMFNLDVVITVEIVPVDGKYLVTSGIFYAGEARQLDTIVTMLDLRTKRDALGEVRPFFAHTSEANGGIPDLAIDAQLFAAADLEGNGTLQYIFSDGVNLHIFKQGPADWREDWAEKNSYAAREIQHINIDVADINGNGRPEIFLTAMVNGAVVSTVIESKDGVYQRIAEVPGFLRVVTSSRAGSILIGQGYSPVSFFAGEPRRYVWSGGTYVPGADFPLPKGVGLYGFAYAECGEAKPLLVALDDKEQLNVYSQGTLIWKSEEKYPAVGIMVTKPVIGIEAAIAMSSHENDKAQQVKIAGRVTTADLNGDGKDEILLPRNSGATFLSGHKEAEFVSLGWTGARLERLWKINDIPGAVLDYQIYRPQGMGAQILTLVIKRGGLFSADRVRVIVYGTM